MENDFVTISKGLIQAGQIFYSKGWVPATSGNFSARLGNGNIAITVSGRHKGMLGPDDIMIVDAKGNSLMDKKPSAETLLHLQIYDFFPDTKCVLHPHTINATLLSRYKKSHIVLQDYELLKAFPGIDTHECTVVIPLFKNDQNIPRLSEIVKDYLKTNVPVFGYLIEGHGFYTWGESIMDCVKRVEAFEFLFECEVKELLLGKI
jgi:methylthioribulose-1-phosphate dehydratase